MRHTARMKNSNFTNPSSKPANSQPPRYRSVWISDVHLGARGCQADKLSAFLDAHSCEQLYLVGDIVDGWRLKRDFYWPQAHTNVIRKILGQSRHGTQVYWIAGNHDEFLRKFIQPTMQLGNIQIVNSLKHETVCGRNFLVMHGDIYDAEVRYRSVLSRIGSLGYRGMRRCIREFNKLRVKLGYSYWSLSSFTRRRTKTAGKLVADYVDVMTHECRQRGYDGIICGHIHHPEICDMGGVMYYNCGDWVEHCTALVETFDGKIELVSYSSLSQKETAKIVAM